MSVRNWLVAVGIIAVLIAGSDLLADGPGPRHDLRVVQQEIRPVLDAGSVVSVPVVVVNDGLDPWVSEDGFALSYHWLDTGGTVVTWDGRRTALPTTVGPGTEIAMVASVEIPRRPGSYRLVWDIVQEGARWVSEEDPTPVAPTTVEVRAAHAFSVVEGASRSVMFPGSEAVVRLRVRNDGSRPWRADGSFAFSYHWLDGKGAVAGWEGRRTSFPHEVVSGELVEIHVELIAPPRAGFFFLQWDLVEEGVCWFSERAADPLPLRPVLVYPDLLASPMWWAVFSLGIAFIVVSAYVRGGPKRKEIALLLGFELWCVASLTVKQGLVLAETGVRATCGGWFLILGGACGLILLTHLLPRRLRLWACWGLVAVVTLLLWSDGVYLRFFGDLPSATVFLSATQLGNVGASIRSLLLIRDLWLWLDLVPGLVLMLVAARLVEDADTRARRMAAIPLVTAVVLAVGAGLHLAAKEPGLFQQVFRRVVVAREIGVLNLHAVDFSRHLVRGVRSSDLDPDVYRKAVAWFRGRAPLRAGAGAFFGAAEGFNLIMVQVESLQGFVVDLEINGREITPFLNSWKASALWFPNVTDQSGLGRSSDSELATQTSLLPFDDGAAAFRFAENDFTGLAEVLSGRGYETISAVPYDGAFWNRRLTHPAFGFRRNLFAGDFAAGENIGWGLNDHDFLAQAVEKMTAAQLPFCAYLLTLSLHHPFIGFPDHLKALDVGAWEDTPFGNFLHTMHFFDASLESFVASLTEAGLAESSVITIWGDHDAGFAWTPEIASVMGVTHDPSGWYLSQEVPLFIRVPGPDAPRGEVAAAAGHTDVAPTLLALLGVDPSPYAYVGRNLLGNAGDVPVVGEYGCWRDADHLFLQGGSSLEEGTCIELATMAPVAPEECAAAFLEARRTEAISSVTLDWDLQGRINADLIEGGRQRE
jgi:phosphoglycerol transferase MdoB-like AlkP superfamily enzyme